MCFFDPLLNISNLLLDRHGVCHGVGRGGVRGAAVVPIDLERRGTMRYGCHERMFEQKQRFKVVVLSSAEVYGLLVSLAPS